MSRPKASPIEVERRRQQIVAGARHCFAIYGFDGTTVEYLERHCGCTRGTLFRYYSSKAAILTAVVAAEEAAQQPQYEAILAAAAAAGEGPAEVIAAALRLQLKRVTEDPVPTRLRLELLALGLRDKRWAARVRKLEEQQRLWRRSLVEQTFANCTVQPAARIEALTDAISVIFFGLAIMRALSAPIASSDQELIGLASMMTASLMEKPKKPKSVVRNAPARRAGA